MRALMRRGDDRALPAAVDVHAVLVDPEHPNRVSVTDAKASLISQRSMSPGCSPAFSSAFLAAAAGVVARYA